jgi:hypothetical protein
MEEQEGESSPEGQSAKFQWTEPSKGEPSVSPHREGAGPPSTLGGGGGLVYGRRKNESGPTGLWMDSPERATGVGVGPMRWIVHVWEGVIRLEGWGEGI